MKATKKQPLTFKRAINTRHFKITFLLFVIFQMVLYAVILAGQSHVTFDKYNYLFNAHHSVYDRRLENPKDFHLPEAMAQFDAQFYINIATKGYVHHPTMSHIDNKLLLDTPSYAFSPIYPMTVGLVHIFVKSVVMSAFILSLIYPLIGSAVVYWLVAKWYDIDLAARTSWLIFVYPVSIFYRSYYAEGLFLILLAILMDALLSKKWVRASITAGFLTVTRYIGAVGIIVLGGKLLYEHAHRRLTGVKFFKIISLSLIPILIFTIYCYYLTGHPFYYLSVRSLWKPIAPPPIPTFVSIAYFKDLPWHHFHLSRFDTMSIVLFGVLMYFSRKWLPKPWWYLGLFLWLVPIMTIDTMSASRYQIVNLPLFLYAAHLLSGWKFRVWMTISIAGLFLIALLFVNWVWIG